MAVKNITDLHVLGDVGIGTTSPTEKLHVEGGNILVGTDSGDPFNASALVGIQGTTAAYFQAKTNTSGSAGLLLGDTADDYHAGLIYSNSTSAFTFNAGNGTRLTIDGTLGNVGIGTTTPGSRLEVYSGVPGSIKLGGLSNYNGISLNGTLDIQNYNLLSRSTDKALYINRPSGNDIFFRENNTDTQVIIKSGGDVGIGTTSPSGKLHVSDISTDILTESTTGAARNILKSSTGEWRLGTNAGQGNNFWVYEPTLAQYVFNITPAGNVGIGTTSISNAKLKVAGGGVDIESSTDSLRLRFYNGTTFQSGFQAVLNTGEMISGSVSGDMAIRSQSNMLFAAGGSTERMRITSAGNVGIGTTSPSTNLQTGDGSAGLDTAVRAYHSDGAYTELRGYGIQTNRGTAYFRPITDKNLDLNIGHDSRDWDRVNIGTNIFKVSTDTTEHFRINSSGNVGIGTTNPSSELHVDGVMTLEGGSRSNPSGVNEAVVIDYQLSGGSVGRLRSRDWDNGVWKDFIIQANDITLDADGAMDLQTSALTWNGDTLATQSWVIANAGTPTLDAVTTAGNTTTNNISVGGLTSTGNVGIGTTSPSSKLHVYTATGRSFEVDQSTSNITTLKNDYHLRLQAGGGYDVQFYAGSTPSERMRIASNGNVGIGTTSPASVLHIKNSVPEIVLEDSDTANRKGKIVANNGNLGLFADSDNVQSNSIIYFNIDSSEKMRIASNGNVGIGTTNPFYKLHVVGETYLDGRRNFGDGTATWYWAASGGKVNIDARNFSISGDTGAQLHKWNRNTADTFYLPYYENWYDGNSYHSIGVENNSWQLSDGLSVAGNIALVSNNSFISFNTSASSGDPKIQMGSDGDFSFLNTAGSTNFHIENGGNVGIGTTSPGTNLHIVSSSYEGMRLERSGASTGVSLYLENGNNNTWIVGNGGNDHFAINKSGSSFGNEFIIQDSGNVGIGDSSPSEKLEVNGNILASGDITAFSDANLKENVETVSDALDKVKGMRGVTFNKIGEEKRSVGVIAQELLEVLPEAVHKSGEHYSVAYGNIVGVLIEAMKEQQAQIDELKAMINGSTK